MQRISEPLPPEAVCVQLGITLVHHALHDLTAPSPVVLRAYSAYGLCADLAHSADDLSLLERCATLPVHTA